LANAFLWGLRGNIYKSYKTVEGKKEFLKKKEKEVSSEKEMEILN
jgi:hypothetical protein